MNLESSVYLSEKKKIQQREEEEGRRHEIEERFEEEDEEVEEDRVEAGDDGAYVDDEEQWQHGYEEEEEQAMLNADPVQRGKGGFEGEMTKKYRDSWDDRRREVENLFDAVEDADHLLGFCATGQVLQKFTKAGKRKPHSRFFFVNVDSRLLCWKNKASGKTHQSVVVRNVFRGIRDIASQSTRRIDPHLLKSCAFTVQTMGSVSRNLCLIAPDEVSCQEWILGLHHVVNLSMEDGRFVAQQ